MKYKQYILTFEGDNPEVLRFLRNHVPDRHNSLKDAKDMGRAAELLFGVTWKWEAVTLAR